MRAFSALAAASFVFIAIACGSSSDDKNGAADPSATNQGDGGPNGNPDGSPTTSGGPTTVGTTGDGSPVPYNQATFKTIHNAYDRDEPFIDQMLYDNVRSLEIDIHKGKGDDAPAGQWYVYHADIPTQDGTSCKFLDDCLAAVAAFHKAMPNHEVVTLYIDLKDDFIPGHAPDDLDARFVNALGRENIVAPGDLITACNGATTVKAAVGAPCGWPTLGALRGKFIIAGTGGSMCDATSHASTYGGAKPSDRVMFISADLNDDCALDKYDAHPDVVFFNMSLDDKSHAQGVKDKGLIGRIYKGGLNGGLDSADDFAAARAAGAVQLATDEVNVSEDPWSTTTSAKGFPFLCDGCDATVEGTKLLAVSATSGDQWDAADSGFFGYASNDGPETWTAMIGVPSSHTTEFAKACLVARASEDANAPNVAFCRPFDNNMPRLQLRNTAGESTSEDDMPPYPNQSDESAFFLRLVLVPDGGDTNIDAQSSLDGNTWTSFEQRVIHSALPLRGISVSSHGGGKLHAFFAGLTRTAPDLPPEPITASKLTKKAIGSDASGDLADGPIAP